MDVDRPENDQAWDHEARGETSLQRLDRNWSNLLQELRVVQTGVQLLTGFLLTLPFQPRFDMLDDSMRLIYLGSVSCAVGATVLLVAPVGLHRVLFRQRRLASLVSAAHRLAYAGLLLLGAALVGMILIVFDAVAGHRSAYIAGAVATAAFATFWVILPVIIRTSRR
jgi:hypothetical protein